jgi:hypothetical protein
MKNTLIKHSHTALITGAAFVMVMMYWLIHLLCISVQDTSRRDIKSHPILVSHDQNDAGKTQFAYRLMPLASQDTVCIVKPVYKPDNANTCPPTTSDNKKMFIEKSIFI